MHDLVDLWSHHVARTMVANINFALHTAGCILKGEFFREVPWKIEDVQFFVPSHMGWKKISFTVPLCKTSGGHCTYSYCVFLFGFQVKITRL